MVLFAEGGSGLFFNEWYWDPIGRAILALPVLGIVALIAFFAARRRLPDSGHRVWVAMAIIVGGEALILGGGLYWAYGEHARESRVIARTVTFTTYEPRSLPPRFDLMSSAAAAGREAPEIHAFYSLGEQAWASVIQERSPGGRNSRYSQGCLLEGVTDKCHEAHTSKGTRVVLAKSFGPYSLEASALLGSTLVSVTGDRITEPEMLAYFDALRPVAPEELEFKRG
jgi:hypothetical protein